MKRTQRPTTTFQKLSRRRQPDDRGLTLVELLMVITILGILAGIALFSARNLRGEATASATATDSDVIRAAQEAYCYKTGDYAARLRDMTIPPNDVLADDDTYNTSVAYTPDNFDFGTDDAENSVFKGYRAGGAGALGDGPVECGSYEVGAREPNLGGTGAQVLTDDAVAGAVGFLSQSFRDRFGPIGFPTGGPTTLANRSLAPQTNDWLWISSTDLTNPPNPIVDATRREYATGRLVLMACKSGGLSLPVTEACRAPGIGAVVQTPTDIDDLNHFSGGDEPHMDDLAARLGAAPADCGNTPILALQSAGTTFGNAARVLLETNGVTPAEVTALEAAGCIVNDPDMKTARTLMRAGGTINGNEVVLPAKYALLSKEASTDPTGIDTNWAVDVTGEPLTSPIPPISMFAALLDRPVPPADPSHRAQALRFLNYLLSPLGQATLQTYGFGPPTAAITPVPEA